MQPVLLPTSYFPSTTLFVDDNHDFLLNFVLHLDEGVAYRIFDNPSLALKYINRKASEFEYISAHGLRNGSGVAGDPLLRSTIHPELAPISEGVYNPHRFSEISVVVVDYAMPGMNGLEFCRRIQNKNIKKILLTGQADERLAAAAFNEGLIHRYIKKNEDNAAEQVTQSIFELQHSYFQSLSDMVTRLLSVSLPKCLYDPDCIDFFKQFIVKNGIIEYYVVDYPGSFLMLDEDANVSFLMVKRDSELREYAALAEAHGVEEAVRTSIQRGEIMPGFWSGGTIHDWLACLVPASRLHATDAYYYAYVTAHTLLDHRHQKILSYSRYLEELDAEALLSD